MQRRPDLVITFHKVVEPRPRAWWDATRRTGGRLRGGFMPIGRGVIPHDMAHYAAEVGLGIDDGFWGLLARGATFVRGTSAKRTKPGRALVAANRAALNIAENVGNAHHAAWMEGQPTPVAAVLDELAREWARVPDGGTMTLTWPRLP